MMKGIAIAAGVGAFGLLCVILLSGPSSRRR
jgi:hypothetical protein